jgi:large subunit ribosomal protein L2
MGIKSYKPTTPTLRYKQISAKTEVTAEEPYKPLTVGIKRSSGRDSQGHISSRRRGGGHKKRYRIIDFKRKEWAGVSCKVETIEYDPNRSAYIALVKYANGSRSYIIAPHGIKVGETLKSGSGVEYKVGNTMPLKDIPLNAQIYNIELKPGHGGQLARSAGTSAELVSKDEKYCQVRLPSGEVRLILSVCLATVGQTSNIDHNNEVSGSAGRSRWLGIRPSVRGVVMNPIDHPLGGGEGRTSGGRHPCSPWGKNCKGKKTRNNKRTDKMIVRRRQKKRS